MERGERRSLLQGEPVRVIIWSTQWSIIPPYYDTQSGVVESGIQYHHLIYPVGFVCKMMWIKEFTIPLVRDVSYYRDEVPLSSDIPSLWYIISPILCVIRQVGEPEMGGIILKGIILKGIKLSYGIIRKGVKLSFSNTIVSKKSHRSFTYFVYSGFFILPSISSILLGSSKYHCASLIDLTLVSYTSPNSWSSLYHPVWVLYLVNSIEKFRF